MAMTTTARTTIARMSFFSQSILRKELLDRLEEHERRADTADHRAEDEADNASGGELDRAAARLNHHRPQRHNRLLFRHRGGLGVLTPLSTAIHLRELRAEKE